MSYPAAALFYWQNAKRVRKLKDGIARNTALENLRLVANVDNYPRLKRLAMRDLELLNAVEVDESFEEVYGESPIKLEWPR